MSKIDSAAWNRCYSPEVFRTAYRLDQMLAGRISLELKPGQLRGLTDCVRSDAAVRRFEAACEALNFETIRAEPGGSIVVQRRPGGARSAETDATQAAG